MTKAPPHDAPPHVADDKITHEIADIEQKIRDNPLGSVAVGFAAGLLIAYLLKRK